ncbi:MAG: polyprenyl diphosphate synthase [Methanomicrobiales archaeon]|nr:polyprenyl diphosphate synthase [Methanomicrobiales archaeon]
MTLRDTIDGLYERYLRMQIRHVPLHIAIIQDGNRRYARDHGIQTRDGHRAGADTTERMLDWAREAGVKYITLYSFSTENFRRTDEEISHLFALFKEKFTRVTGDERVHRYQIRVRIFGDRTMLPPDLLERVEAAEEATRHYRDFFLNIALAYGGRNEIVCAARSLLQQVGEGRISPDAIDPAMVEKHLYSGEHLPPVDLIVRTGNEQRTSNFLPWLANGMESTVYFAAPYWPSFRRIDFLRAIRVYDQRMRLSAGERAVLPLSR